jgi:hypothetical protein
MIVDDIRELMNAQPFLPVRITLGNQQSFIIKHTDYLMISPDRQTVALYDENGRFRFLNAPQIRVVEQVEGPSPKAA